MKKYIGLAAVAVALITLSGCMSYPNSDVISFGYVNSKGSGSYYDSSVKALKRGEAESKGILFIVTGDATVAAAMKDGGITKLQRVEYETSGIFGIIATYKTIVYGE